MKDLRNILFDFDGVILESVDSKTKAFAELYKEFGPDVVKKVVHHHLENGGMSRFEKIRLYHKTFLEKELSNEELQTWCDRFAELSLQDVLNSPFVDGVKKFLDETVNKYSLWVVTATPEQEILSTCRHLKITHYFQKILGSPRKKVDLVSDLVKEKSVALDDSIFIGDSINDFEAAQKNGIKFILRETDYNRDTFRNFHGVRIPHFAGVKVEDLWS